METKHQTNIIFETILSKTPKFGTDSVDIVDLHRLPQHPIKKNKILIIRPIIIVKVLTTFNVDIIFQKAAKLKNYNEGRDSPVFITDYLLKLFHNKKKIVGITIFCC